MTACPAHTWQVIEAGSTVTVHSVTRSTAPVAWVPQSESHPVTSHFDKEGEKHAKRNRK